MAKLTRSQIAEMAGVSKGRVSQMAKALGRTPTIEELIERKGKRGRPSLDNTRKVVLAFISNKRKFKVFMECLKEKYGVHTTIKEIIEKMESEV